MSIYTYRRKYVVYYHVKNPALKKDEGINVKFNNHTLYYYYYILYYVIFYFILH